MENIEKIRFDVVRAMLEEFPELRERVRQYLSIIESIQEVKELMKSMKEQNFSETAISNVAKIYC